MNNPPAFRPTVLDFVAGDNPTRPRLLPGPNEWSTEGFNANISYLSNTVTWGDGQTPQRVDGIHLDVYLDTLNNTAFFKLHCSILFKGDKSRDKKQPLFLFIHPESINNITPEAALHAVQPSCQSLSFSLARHPSLVIPKNYILESKPKTKTLLNSIQALAGATEFTIHVNACNITAHKQAHLELITWMFSSNSGNRPLTDGRCANVDSLYAGRGGEVANASVAEVETYTGADLSPLYRKSARSDHSNKRRRRDSDTENGQCLTAPNDVLFKYSHTCDIDSHNSAHLNSICARLDGIENRLERLERNVSAVLNISHSYQYGTEERTGALEMIHDRIGDFLSSLRVESAELYKSIENEAYGATEWRGEEANERIQHQEGILGNTAQFVE